MDEEEVKHTPSYVAYEKTLLLGGRKQYMDDKSLKMFIIIKCMATLFLVPSYNHVTRKRKGWENDQALGHGSSCQPLSNMV